MKAWLEFEAQYDQEMKATEWKTQWKTEEWLAEQLSNLYLINKQ